MASRRLASANRILGVLLVLFVLFHLWFKRTDFNPVQSDRSELVESPSSHPDRSGSTSPPPTNVTDPLTDAQSPEFRLIELGPAPSTELKALSHDLEQGDLSKVEHQLRNLSPPLPATKRTRQFAAALWNNLGIRLGRSAGIAASVRAFKQGALLDPTNPTILLNLTEAYWESHDKALTATFLRSVIRVAPHDPFPRIVLADLLMEQGRMKEARQQLEAARRNGSISPALVTYFEHISGKLHRLASSKLLDATSAPPSAPALAPPLPLASQPPALLPAGSRSSKEMLDKPAPPSSRERFTISFQGKPDQDVALRVQAILNYAFEEITAKLGAAPRAPIQMVIHTEATFPLQARSPAEADALYDHGAAFLHLPLNGAMDDLAVLSRVLRHQLVHALLQSTMGIHMERVPTWLVEGLAIHLAEDLWPTLEDTNRQPLSPIPLSSLEQPWNGIPADSLDQAYGQSARTVAGLLSRYGMTGVRRILDLIQAGRSFDEAMKEIAPSSPERFGRTEDHSLSSFLNQRTE
ncbi:MAG: hypothetical protein NNA21_08610 [Nitrospira sp.]|nr:hypothetical protein [Nitrospira sp.]MCP9462252.1 hypothetical protein [Nitrospira sp.]MCP9474491.1 hypothetical protein [Nitrospira sp.]